MNRPSIHWLCITAGVALSVLAAACGGGGQTADRSPTATAQGTKPAPTSTSVSVTTAVATQSTRTPVPSATPALVPPTAPVPAAVATPVPAPTEATAPPPPPPPPPASGTTLTIAAINTLFSPPSVTLPAGATVTLTFDNQDDGVTHDIAIFDPGGAPIGGSALGTGPILQTLTFTLGGPGAYSFKCSVHPQQMRGFIKVQ